MATPKYSIYDRANTSQSSKLPSVYEDMEKIIQQERELIDLRGQVTDEVGYVQQALDFLDSVKVPTTSEMQFRLQRAVEVGELTPIEAQEILATPDMWEQLTISPEVKQAQYRVLNRLGEIAKQGGLDAQARARLERIASDEAMKERGSREAIIQQAAQQGRAGGGLDLAQRLMAQQGSAQSRALRGTEVAAEAERRALEALMAQGQQAGQMRGQEFGEQERVAAAKQAINQFNVANQLAQQEANIGRQMEAQKDKLAEKRRVADFNISQADDEAVRRSEIAQQRYQMEMQKALPKADIRQQQASQWRADSIAEQQRQHEEKEAARQRKSEKRKQTLSTLATIGVAMFSDKNMKHQERPVDAFDVDNFLSGLTGYKFKYKGDDQEKMGVMAQDLEKSPEGQEMVVDTPIGKMVDPGELLNGLLATNVNLNDRVKELEKKYGK